VPLSVKVKEKTRYSQSFFVVFCFSSLFGRGRVGSFFVHARGCFEDDGRMKRGRGDDFKLKRVQRITMIDEKSLCIQ